MDHLNITTRTGLKPRVIKNPRTGKESHTISGNIDLAIGTLSIAAAQIYSIKAHRVIPVLNAFFSRDQQMGGIEPHRHPEILSLTIQDLRDYITGQGTKASAALRNYQPRPTQRKMIGKL